MELQLEYLICPVCTYHNNITSISCTICLSSLFAEQTSEQAQQTGLAKDVKRKRKGAETLESLSNIPVINDEENYVVCPHCTFHYKRGEKFCDACSGTLRKYKKVTPDQSSLADEVILCE